MLPHLETVFGSKYLRTCFQYLGREEKYKKEKKPYFLHTTAVKRTTMDQWLPEDPAAQRGKFFQP